MLRLQHRGDSDFEPTLTHRAGDGDRGYPENKQRWRSGAMEAGGHAATFGRRRTSYPRLLRRRTRLLVVRLRACWSRKASPSSWKGIALPSIWNTATRILCAMAMAARRKLPTGASFAGRDRPDPGATHKAIKFLS